MGVRDHEPDAGATSAFSLTFPGSRKSGKQLPMIRQEADHPTAQQRRSGDRRGPELGDAELQGAQPGVERAITKAAAAAQPLR